MIKLKLLLESIPSKPFSDIGGRNHLISHYETAFEKWLAGDILYRGHRSRANYEEVYPSQGERESVDASNLYTVLLSRLPSWKNWPQRSHSLILSVSSETAEEYNPLYYVFPDENAKLVIAPTSDILSRTSFPVLWNHTKLKINEVEILSKIMSILNNSKHPDDIHDIHNLKADDYEKFIQHLQKVATKNKILKLYNKLYMVKQKNKWQPPEEWMMLDLIDAYIKNYKIHNGNWELFLDFLLNPESNGFELIPFSKFKVSNYSKNENEVWTDSNCMLIKLNEKLHLRELGKNVLI